MCSEIDYLGTDMTTTHSQGNCHENHYWILGSTAPFGGWTWAVGILANELLGRGMDFKLIVPNFGFRGRIIARSELQMTAQNVPCNDLSLLGLDYAKPMNELRPISEAPTLKPRICLLDHCLHVGVRRAMALQVSGEVECFDH